MRSQVPGLNQAHEMAPLVEGLYRGRVVKCELPGHAAKPCRALTFLILDPPAYAGRHIHTRLYSHDRALWKRRWFLTDFGYDHELFADEVLDDRRVLGLEGLIRLGHWGSNGHQRLDVQGFARAEHWAELRLNQVAAAQTPKAEDCRQSV